jgi:hypothetical protein
MSLHLQLQIIKSNLSDFACFHSCLRIHAADQGAFFPNFSTFWQMIHIWYLTSGVAQRAMREAAQHARGVSKARQL